MYYDESHADTAKKDPYETNSQAEETQQLMSLVRDIQQSQKTQVEKHEN